MKKKREKVIVMYKMRGWDWYRRKYIEIFWWYVTVSFFFFWFIFFNFYYIFFKSSKNIFSHLFSICPVDRVAW